MGMDPHSITCPGLLKAAGISALFDCCESRTRLSHSTDHSPPLQPIRKIARAVSITRGILHLKVFGKWVELTTLPQENSFRLSDKLPLWDREGSSPLYWGISALYYNIHKTEGPQGEISRKALYLVSRPEVSARLPSALQRHCRKCHHRHVTPLCSLNPQVPGPSKAVGAAAGAEWGWAVSQANVALFCPLVATHRSLGTTPASVDGWRLPQVLQKVGPQNLERDGSPCASLCTL